MFQSSPQPTKASINTFVLLQQGGHLPVHRSTKKQTTQVFRPPPLVSAAACNSSALFFVLLQPVGGQTSHNTNSDLAIRPRFDLVPRFCFFLTSTAFWIRSRSEVTSSTSVKKLTFVCRANFLCPFSLANPLNHSSMWIATKGQTEFVDGLSSVFGRQTKSQQVDWVTRQEVRNYCGILGQTHVILEDQRAL